MYSQSRFLERIGHKPLSNLKIFLASVQLWHGFEKTNGRVSAQQVAAYNPSVAGNRIFKDYKFN